MARIAQSIKEQVTNKVIQEQKSAPKVALDPMAMLEQQTLVTLQEEAIEKELEKRTADPIEELEKAGHGVMSNESDVDDDSVIEETPALSSSSLLPSGPMTREVLKVPVFARVRQEDDELSDENESGKQRDGKRAPKSSRKHESSGKAQTWKEHKAQSRKMKVEEMVSKAKAPEKKEELDLEHLTPLERMMLRREEMCENTVIESKALRGR